MARSPENLSDQERESSEWRGEGLSKHHRHRDDEKHRSSESKSSKHKHKHHKHKHRRKHRRSHADASIEEIAGDQCDRVSIDPVQAACQTDLSEERAEFLHSHVDVKEECDVGVCTTNAEDLKVDEHIVDNTKRTEDDRSLVPSIGTQVDDEMEEGEILDEDVNQDEFPQLGAVLDDTAGIATIEQVSKDSTEDMHCETEGIPSRQLKSKVPENIEKSLDIDDLSEQRHICTEKELSPISGSFKKDISHSEMRKGTSTSHEKAGNSNSSHLSSGREKDKNAGSRSQESDWYSRHIKDTVRQDDSVRRSASREAGHDSQLLRSNHERKDRNRRSRSREIPQGQDRSRRSRSRETQQGRDQTRRSRFREAEQERRSRSREGQRVSKSRVDEVSRLRDIAYDKRDSRSRYESRRSRSREHSKHDYTDRRNIERKRSRSLSRSGRDYSDRRRSRSASRGARDITERRRSRSRGYPEEHRDKRRRSRSRESSRDRDRRRSLSRIGRDYSDRRRSRSRGHYGEHIDKRRRSRSREAFGDRRTYESIRHRSVKQTQAGDHDRASNRETINKAADEQKYVDGQAKGTDSIERDDEDEEEYQDSASLQSEEDVDKEVERIRMRRQAIMEKHKKQEQQESARKLDLNEVLEPTTGTSESIGDVKVYMDENPSVVSDISKNAFNLDKDSLQNGMIERPSGTRGLGEGTPKSEEKVNDMFSDYIFGESPAGGRKQVKGDGVALETSGLTDNWDDGEGYYCHRIGEVLDGRYEIAASHGRGVFSSVVRARDLKATRKDLDEVAIKIIRNNDVMLKSGQQELSILRKLDGADPENRRHCVRFLTSFDYRKHLCLVFESMHMNLREVLKKFGRNIGLNLGAVRVYAKQLFIALKHLRNCGVLHCDIKPDNMLVNESKKVLKLCDFGSAMFAGENEITPYLVSRFYRAPEIILGLPYDHPLDMWSVGCCLYEFFTGKVLFPGPTNNDMLRLHMELKGPFPKKMLKKAAFASKHFDQDYNFCAVEEDPVTKASIKRVLVNVKPKDIATLVTGQGTVDESGKMLNNFRDLLDKIFMLDPEKRLTVSQALSHPFITGK
ncbi:hypothetical protein KP509_01G007000 [Ceratopteris richardii]|uniref:non-specific serine/threonine protein kinase n=1 Tax=Ceratopteris richardii TaxID=49495 RepID=A0A8T2VDV0_CERRI|nr:hypothetical protein KP509_01G007000 [Ceratopteris richardii]